MGYTIKKTVETITTLGASFQEKSRQEIVRCRQYPMQIGRRFEECIGMSVLLSA